MEHVQQLPIHTIKMYAKVMDHSNYPVNVAVVNLF